MSVWKKKTVRYFVGDKRSSKGVKGAVPHTEESKRWYGTLKTYDQKKRQVPLTEDKDTSEKLLRTLQRTEDERRVNGYTKVQEQGEKPIAEHLRAFQTHMESKNNVPQHIKTTISSIQKLIDTTGVETIADLDGGKILNTLASWRKRKTKSMSVVTSNHYLTAGLPHASWARERGYRASAN